MSAFRVELKKIVDDSYDIETGFHLQEKLISDIQSGLMGRIRKFAVVTDSVVKDLYAADIARRIQEAGYAANLYVFAAGEKSKTRKTKKRSRTPCSPVDAGGIAALLP